MNEAKVYTKTTKASPKEINADLEEARWSLDTRPTMKWELEWAPQCSFQFARRPSLWTRIGLFVWFGLRVRRIKE